MDRGKFKEAVLSCFSPNEASSLTHSEQETLIQRSYDNLQLALNSWVYIKSVTPTQITFDIPDSYMQGARDYLEIRNSGSLPSAEFDHEKSDKIYSEIAEWMKEHGYENY